MARKIRINYPHAFYHVMLRGNNKQPIFFCDEDLDKLMQLIEEGVNRFKYRVHAFCFMKNHIHLALKTSDVSLSGIMHNIAFRYTGYINRRYERVGHVFQGRFKSLLVDENAYFLQLIKYIHLNPVKAGVVANPESYQWSSHNAYLGCANIDWLDTQFLLDMFEGSEAVSRVRYKTFMANDPKELSAFECKLKSFCLSNEIAAINDHEDFAEELTKTDKKLEQLVIVIMNKYQISLELLSSKLYNGFLSFVRGMLCYISLHHAAVSLDELRLILKRDSYALKQMASRFQSSPLKKIKVKQDVDEILKLLSLKSEI